MPPGVTATVVDEDPEAYEERHVHAVYDHIASHFSSTRYKVVTDTLVLFAATLSDNSPGLSSQNFYRVYPLGG
jgi:tRNA (uracil-5-)-methyltransferase TRM9